MWKIVGKQVSFGTLMSKTGRETPYRDQYTDCHTYVPLNS